MAAFKFYCRGCRKSFSTNSVDRHQIKSRYKKGKTMLAYAARCPKCGHEAWKMVGKGK